MKKVLLALVAALGMSSAAQAATTSVPIITGTCLEDTGVTFSGDVTYNSDTQVLQISLTNTSGFQSVITGFFFDITGDSTATFTDVNDPATTGVDESAFEEDTSLPPFGDFDAGVSLADLSMQQVKGIDEGETGVFTFNISGTGADTLEAADFGFNEGQFAVRYQSVGLDAEGSDKCTAVIIPLPPAVWSALATAGFAGVFGIRRRFVA